MFTTHPIIQVAVADVDAAYGAYAAAENNTFNNANGSINNANNRNNNANYSSNNMYGQYLFLAEDVEISTFRKVYFFYGSIFGPQTQL